MIPFKIFLSLRDWLLAEEALIDIQADDPFRHPDIRSMTLRQLADLPLGADAGQMADSETIPLAKCA